MRGHFEHEFFGFPPGFGPWDRSCGPWGPGRSPFNLTGWLNFGRYGCRPHSPPEFHSPDRYRNPHHESEHGLSHHYRSSGCGRPGPSQDNNGPPHHCGPPGRHGPPGVHGPIGLRGPPGCNRPLYSCHEESEDHNKPHRSCGCERRGHCEDHHEHSECRRGPPDHDQDYHSHSQGRRGLSPRRGPPRHEDYYHHGHGYGYGPRNGYNWHDFGTDGFGPQKARRQRDNRSGPYDKSRGCTERRREDCYNNLCCMGNRDNQESNPNEDFNVRNKDRNATENTVLVQRIVVERTPARPQSV